MLHVPISDTDKFNDNTIVLNMVTINKNVERIGIFDLNKQTKLLVDKYVSIYVQVCDFFICI